MSCLRWSSSVLQELSRLLPRGRNLLEMSGTSRTMDRSFRNQFSGSNRQTSPQKATSVMLLAFQEPHGLAQERKSGLRMPVVRAH